jgi:hypothetical protein
MGSSHAGPGFRLTADLAMPAAPIVHRLTLPQAVKTPQLPARSSTSAAPASSWVRGGYAAF